MYVCLCLVLVGSSWHIRSVLIPHDFLQTSVLAHVPLSPLMDPCGMCVIGVPHTCWGLNRHNRLCMDKVCPWVSLLLLVWGLDISNLVELFFASHGRTKLGYCLTSTDTMRPPRPVNNLPIWMKTTGARFPFESVSVLRACSRENGVVWLRC